MLWARPTGLDLFPPLHPHARILTETIPADKQNKSPASLELVYHKEHKNGIPKGYTRLWVAEKRRAWTMRKGRPFHCCVLGEQRGSCATWETGKGVSTARGTKELQQCGRRQ